MLPKWLCNGSLIGWSSSPPEKGLILNLHRDNAAVRDPARSHAEEMMPWKALVGRQRKVCMAVMAVLYELHLIRYCSTRNHNWIGIARSQLNILPWSRIRKWNVLPGLAQHVIPLLPSWVVIFADILLPGGLYEDNVFLGCCSCRMDQHGQDYQCAGCMASPFRCPASN